MTWVNCPLGLWLIAAPFALAYPNESSALWEDVILGILIGSFPFSRAVSTEVPSMTYVSLAVAAAGLWVLLAPCIFAYTGVRAAFNNDTVVGSAVLILGPPQALSSSERASASREPHHPRGEHEGDGGHWAT